jgi:hypothetical protein
MTETTAAPPQSALGTTEIQSEPSPLAALRRGWHWPSLDARQGAIFCVLVYVVLAILAYLPVGPFESRALPIAGPGNPAGSDPFQMTWFLSWVPFALTHGQSLFHTNYIDYPTGVNLADNTSVPLLGVLGWPLTATLGPVAAFNFLVRLSFVLSATSMFFVMRRWCRTWQAPFVAGLLYAFGPYTASQELHLDLIFIPLPPLLVLLGDELVRRQRMRPALLGVLAGVVAGLEYLVSPDVLSGCASLAVIAGIGLAIRFRHEIRDRLPYITKAAPFALAGFIVLAGYPILEILVGAGHLHGPVITLNSLQRTRADLFGPVVPTSNQLLVPGFISHIGDYFVDGNLSENGSYIGIPLLVLLIVIIRRLRHNATVVTFAWLGLAAFVISLGNYLVIGTWRSPLPMPEYVYAHLPLLENTIPARYALYVLVFASMIVGIGLDHFWLARRADAAPAWDAAAPPPSTPAPSGEPAAGPAASAGWRLRAPRLLRSRRRQNVLLGAVVALSLLPAVPYASRGLVWPAALPTTIGRVVEPGTVVLTFPFATPSSTQPMAWQASDHMGFRIMGGYANIVVPGQHVGQRWPLLLKPHSVQDILGFTHIGDRFPQPPIPDPGIEAQLRQYLVRYSIGAVVAWTSPPEFAFVYQYFLAAIGPPQVTRHNFDIWLPVHGKWPRP